MQDHWTYRSGDVNQYLIENGLHDVLQSAYKQNHRTESLLLEIQNDLLVAIDIHGGAVSILLNLSDAFDIIYSSILLLRLHDMGIRGAPLDWFRSNCRQWRQSIVISIVHGHHIEICLSKCPRDNYLAEHSSPCIQPAGCNSTVILMEFSYVNDIAVHGLQTKQYGIITPNDQQHPISCHWHQVLDDD